MFPIILIRLHFLEIQQILKTCQELSLTSTLEFSLFVFLFVKTFLIIGISLLKYFKDTEANINDIPIMMGNFNIRDSSWDPLFPNHSIYSNMLTDIADFLGLCISSATIQVFMRYVNNPNNLNLVIDLMFL